MYHRSMATLALLILSLAIAPAAARRTNVVPQLAPNTPGHALATTAGKSQAVRHASASADTLILGEWDFENGSLPDPQGWTTFDATAQAGTFFTVEDFAGLGGGTFGRLTPLSGQHSLWCGTRNVPDIYSYATLPGYGNDWDQRFESRAFSVSGRVSVTFRIRYDTEASYDFTYFQYRSKTGNWRDLSSFTGRGDVVTTAAVPIDSIAGSVRLRFRFTSDEMWSDQDGVYPTDGAAIIDSLTVRDAGGVVDFQDFESDLVGGHTTADGDWTASVPAGYGNYAALFDGSSVLQLDPLVSNQTHLWGFFNGSTVNYACGGHPEQTAVPFGRMIEGRNVALEDWIVSPLIPITQDVHGVPVEDPARILLEFDVYRDLPEDNMIGYRYWVRSFAGAVESPWRSNNHVYFGDSPADWFRFQMNLIARIDAGATHIQVAIEAIDMCPICAPGVGTGTCHSNAPLIDNVRVVADDVHDEYVVINSNDSGAGSLRQAILDAKDVRAPARIVFNIPGTGFHEIGLASVLPSLSISQIVIDGTSQPGYAGTPLIGVTLVSAGTSCISMSGGWCELYGLKFHRATTTGIALYILSGGNIVQACAFTGWNPAIRVAGNGNRIGGPEPGEGNSFTVNGIGVSVQSGTGNAIRGNSMQNNSGLAIDLGVAGVRANDNLDVDTGPNQFQNYPVLDRAVTQPGQTQVSGMFSTSPNGTYGLDFFANDVCHASGHGEGKTYLGSTTVATDGTGTVSFLSSLGVAAPVGSRVTTTATDASGNTSEFSACVEVINTPGGSGVSSTPIDSTTGGAPATVTFDNVITPGNTTLVTGPSGPLLPGSFEAGEGTYYNLSTTATFTGSVEVCITYNPANLLVPESSLRLLHYDAAIPDWVDVTTSLNTTTHIVCGDVTSLSPFVLAASTATGITPGAAIPTAFALLPNVPNPFNPTTMIGYDVPKGGADVTIVIYDVGGRRVRTLVSEHRTPGRYQATWDGRSDRGSATASGVYFCRMKAGSFVQTRKLVLLK